MATIAQPRRFVVLAAIDPAPISDAPLAAALELVGTRSDAELHLINVLPPPAFPSGPAIPPMPSVVDDGRTFMQESKRRAAERFAGPVVTHLTSGAPQKEIVRLARELDADVVVVGTHARHGLARWTHTSVSERVAMDAPCPVLIAREKESTAAVPEIEPPCPVCVEVRQKTNGAELWCATHAQKRAHAHLHYSIPPAFGGGAMFLRNDS